MLKYSFVSIMKYKIFMLSYIVSSSKSPACKARLFHHHQRTAWRLHLFSHTIIVWFRFVPSLILITKKVVSPALLSPSTSSATSRTLPPSKNEHPNLVFHSWKCPKCNYTNYMDISHAVFCTNHNKEDKDVVGANKCVICHSINSKVCMK